MADGAGADTPASPPAAPRRLSPVRARGGRALSPRARGRAMEGQRRQEVHRARQRLQEEVTGPYQNHGRPQPRAEPPAKPAPKRRPNAMRAAGEAALVLGAPPPPLRDEPPAAGVLTPVPPPKPAEAAEEEKATPPPAAAAVVEEAPEPAAPEAAPEPVVEAAPQPVAEAEQEPEREEKKEEPEPPVSLAPAPPQEERPPEAGRGRGVFRSRRRRSSEVGDAPAAVPALAPEGAAGSASEEEEEEEDEEEDEEEEEEEEAAAPAVANVSSTPMNFMELTRMAKAKRMAELEEEQAGDESDDDDVDFELAENAKRFRHLFRAVGKWTETTHGDEDTGRRGGLLAMAVAEAEEKEDGSPERQRHHIHYHSKASRRRRREEAEMREKAARRAARRATDPGSSAQARRMWEETRSRLLLEKGGAASPASPASGGGGGGGGGGAFLSDDAARALVGGAGRRGRNVEGFDGASAAVEGEGGGGSESDDAPGERRRGRGRGRGRAGGRGGLAVEGEVKLPRMDKEDERAMRRPARPRYVSQRDVILVRVVFGAWRTWSTDRTSRRSGNKVHKQRIRLYIGSDIHQRVRAWYRRACFGGLERAEGLAYNSAVKAMISSHITMSATVLPVHIRHLVQQEALPIVRRAVKVYSKQLGVKSRITRDAVGHLDDLEEALDGNII